MNFFCLVAQVYFNVVFVIVACSVFVLTLSLLGRIEEYFQNRSFDRWRKEIETKRNQKGDAQESS